MNWTDLTDVDQIAEIDSLSHNEPQWIYKHSTRCIISKMALKKIESSNRLSDFRGYFLDIFRHRNISNQIQDHYKIRHESPQILVIKNGACIFTESHTSIDPGELADLLSTST